jgi:hypothetical protein
VNCPCDECIKLPICKNTDEVSCKDFYQYVVDAEYKTRRLKVFELFKRNARWFRAIDWTVGFSEKEFYK